MTTQQAIQILEFTYINLYQFLSKEYEAAIKLSIQALKEKLKREKEGTP